MTTFRPGDQVFWWRRITREIEYPYSAKVLKVGRKRITITVTNPDGSGQDFIRHVAAEALQLIAGYFGKANGQGPAILKPAAGWGRFAIFLEIGEDLRPVRQVDVFENGNTLSYDRVPIGLMTLACLGMLISIGTANAVIGGYPRISMVASLRAFGSLLGTHRCGLNRRRLQEWRRWAGCPFG